MDKVLRENIKEQSVLIQTCVQKVIPGHETRQAMDGRENKTPSNVIKNIV